MIKIDGWIKLHRKLLDNDLWLACNDSQKVAMIEFLLLANHKTQKIEMTDTLVEIQPGQFVTSIKSLAQKLNSTDRKIRTVIKKFEKYRFCVTKTTNKFTLVTILNWGFYQHPEIENDKQTTSKRQTNDKQTTTNNNDKNDKNDKNNNMCVSNIYNNNIIKPSNIYNNNNISTHTQPPNERIDAQRQQEMGTCSFIIPTLAEIQAYCTYRKNNVNANDFYDHYTAVGWKVGDNPMQDWKAVVRRWERNKFDKSPHIKNNFINYSQTKYTSENWDKILQNKAQQNEL